MPHPPPPRHCALPDKSSNSNEYPCRRSPLLKAAASLHRIALVVDTIALAITRYATTRLPQNQNQNPNQFSLLPLPCICELDGTVLVICCLLPGPRRITTTPRRPLTEDRQSLRSSCSTLWTAVKDPRNTKAPVLAILYLIRVRASAVCRPAANIIIEIAA